MTWIHPTQFILILETVDDIREDDEDGHDPAKNAQEDQKSLLLNEGLDQNHPEECSLSQHPAVGGHHEVGGENCSQQPVLDTMVNFSIHTIVSKTGC